MKYIEKNNEILAKDDIGNVVGKLEFQEVEKGKYNIYSTYVSPEARGKGVALELVKQAVNTIQKRKGQAFATCDYAKKWLEKNKQ